MTALVSDHQPTSINQQPNSVWIKQENLIRAANVAVKPCPQTAITPEEHADAMTVLRHRNDVSVAIHKLWSIDVILSNVSHPRPIQNRHLLHTVI
jgi:hypothetical protein